MTSESWRKMEELASRLTAERNARAKERSDKLERIRQFNRDNPIVFEAEMTDNVQPTIVENRSVYNSADYVLSYLMPSKKRKK